MKKLSMHATTPRQGALEREYENDTRTSRSHSHLKQEHADTGKGKKLNSDLLLLHLVDKPLCCGLLIST
jgi:hypothetical protein